MSDWLSIMVENEPGDYVAAYAYPTDYAGNGKLVARKLGVAADGTQTVSYVTIGTFAGLDGLKRENGFTGTLSDGTVVRGECVSGACIANGRPHTGHLGYIVKLYSTGEIRLA